MLSSITSKRLILSALALSLVVTSLSVLPAQAAISNVYSCTSGDTNGSGSLTICTHTVLNTYSAASIATVYVWGGAGSGGIGNGGTSNPSSYGGAGTVSTFSSQNLISYSCTSCSVVIGAGGGAPSSLNTVGGTGGSSSFNGVSVAGGIGGVTTPGNATVAVHSYTLACASYGAAGSYGSLGSPTPRTQGGQGNNTGGDNSVPGGAGAVIIQYTSAVALASGGSISNCGGVEVHTFLSGGTFSPNSSLFTCTSGDTLSGFTCTHATITTYAGTLVTTASTSQSTSLGCQKGYYLSASTCYANTVTYPATVSNTCPQGGTLYVSFVTLTGYGCTSSDTSVAATANNNYSCPLGGLVSGSNCISAVPVTVPAVPTTTYSCASGTLYVSYVTLNQYACSQVSSSYTATSLTTNTCPSGGTLSGTICTLASSLIGLASPSYTYNCPQGGTLGQSYISLSGYQCNLSASYNYVVYISSGCSYPDSIVSQSYPYETCRKSASSYPANQVTNYSCSIGTLSGTSCVLAGNTYNAIPSVATSCPSGGIPNLAGTLCVIQGVNTVAIATTTYLCSSGTLTGTNCVVSGTSYLAQVTVIYTCVSGSTVGAFCLIYGLNYGSTRSYSCLSSDTLSGSSCTYASVTASPSTIYSGYCASNFALDTSSGACNLVSGYSSGSVGQWLCTSVSTLTTLSTTFVSATDHTGSDGLGNYVQCQFSTSSTNVSASTGYYLCTATDFTSGNAIVYASVNDNTGTSTSAYIYCYSTGQFYTPDVSTFLDVYVAPSGIDIDPCAQSVKTFDLYIACFLQSVVVD